MHYRTTEDQSNRFIAILIKILIDPLVQFGLAHGTAGQSPAQFQSALSKRPARSSTTPRDALARLSDLQNIMYICVYYFH